MDTNTPATDQNAGAPPADQNVNIPPSQQNLQGVMDSLPNGDSGNVPGAGAVSIAPLFEGVTDKTLLQSPALQGINDINGLVSKVVELNAMNPMDAIRIPGENATPDEINQFYSKLGRPEKPEDYGIDPAAGLKEGVNVDPKMKDWFMKAAHKTGLTKAQANALVGDWNNFINDGVAEYKQKFDVDAEQIIGQLKSEYGVALKPKLMAGHRVAQELGGDEFVKLLNEPMVGNNPHVMRFMIKVGEALGEAKFKTGTPSGAGLMAPVEAKAEANRIIGDKSGPYWDKRHPAHNDVVKKVQGLMAMANGQMPE